MDIALRPLEERDLVEFYRWQEEDRNWEWFTCRPVTKVRPYLLFRDRFMDASRRGQQDLMVVEVDGQIAGRVIAFDWNPRNRCLEIGYYLWIPFRRQGIGSAAVSRWVETLFTTRAPLPHKLIATTAEQNRASCALLEALDFLPDGRMREHYLIGGQFSDQMIYSLLRRDWEQGRTAPKI